MCFNEPISWIAFGIGMSAIVATLILSSDPIIIGLSVAFISVVLVQFFEAMAWKGYDKMGANGILALTLLQPVIFAMILLYANT